MAWLVRLSLYVLDWSLMRLQLIRRGNQFAATHTIIVRLVQLIIETGIITGTRPHPAPSRARHTLTKLNP